MDRLANTWLRNDAPAVRPADDEASQAGVPDRAVQSGSAVSRGQRFQLIRRIKVRTPLIPGRVLDPRALAVTDVVTSARHPPELLS
jgi:hypothetical protein